MKTESIVIERIYNAPIELVWKALTEKEQIRQWSFEVSDFKPEVGFEFTFRGGKDGIKIHLSKVVEVITNKKLSYTWRYQGHVGDSLVTFELFPEGEKTKMRLTHEGIETIAINGPEFARENFIQGWTSIIGTLLKEFVEKAA